MNNLYSYQIIDINLNRITGSLRLLEDYFRISGHKNSALRLKEIRHCINNLFDYQKMIKSRNTDKDCGKFFNTEKEISQKSLNSILISNFRRVDESMRVLEEVSKSIEDYGEKVLEIKKFRFEVYEIEKKSMEEKNV